nr:unnamed protein product [Callosobruchus analis]
MISSGNNSNSIVVVGSCMVDFVSYAHRLPKSGETIKGIQFVSNFGGKGANQGVAAAKLGGNVSLVGRVGADDWGAKYIEHLKKLNVNVDHLKITKDAQTGIAQIIVADSGDNLIVITGGANDKLNEKDVVMADSIIKAADVLVLQLETPPEVAKKALELCKGISILNGAPAIANIDSQLLSLPTIFCVNETEATVFSGLPVKSESDARKAGLELLNKGCNNVIITLGRHGALYLNKTGKITHVPSPAVTAVDSTGAGDAFIGALAYLLANKKELATEMCVGLACVAAADSVTKRGTQTSFPTFEVFGME